MKKLILLALIAIVMVGCRKNISRDELLNDLSVTVVVDSCEYLYIKNTNVGLRSHKGNCRFCKERRQKELEELVIRLKEK